jgi:hypothetical protein
VSWPSPANNDDDDIDDVDDDGDDETHLIQARKGLSTRSHMPDMP